MIVQPGSPLVLGLLFLALAVLVFVIEWRVLGYAFRQIGVPPRYMFAVLWLSLVGAHVNVPVAAIPVERLLPPQAVIVFGRTHVIPPAPADDTTIVAINVGGALLPFMVSLYLFARSRLRGRMLLGIAVVGVIIHGFARVVPGVGIAVPMFVPPLAAAVVAVALAFRRAPPVAYVSGSMGALIGADLWNLSRIGELAAPVVSIGGAGTFDGVFLAGIIAGLLAIGIGGGRREEPPTTSPPGRVLDRARAG
jgi:uncharacterized membrane protein